MAPGQPLFQRVNRRNFNWQLGDILTKMQVPEATRYSSHALRRGPTQELKESGPPWSAITPSGFWHSAASRGYVDMSMDVELGGKQLFDVDVDADFDAEEVRRWVFLLGNPMAGLPRPLGHGLRGVLFPR